MGHRTNLPPILAGSRFGTPDHPARDVLSIFIGAIVYFLLRETLSGLGPVYFVLAGLLAIAVTIFMPEGVWGLIRRLFKIDLLPVIQTPDHMTKEN